MKKIVISDITLKNMALEREVALLFREKTSVAACADSIGADVIELAPVKNLREDMIIYKTIAGKVKNAILAIPAGFDTQSVKDAYECIKDAKNPKIIIELPVSTVQMEYTYHVKSDKMLVKIGELVSFAKELCRDVEFSALDATRADTGFLIDVVREAQNKGATSVTVCDDAGISLPEEIGELVKKVKDAVSISVFVKTSDRIGMGVASAISAIKSGADGIKCAMAGKDILTTGEFSDALKTCGAKLNAESSLNYTKIHASIEDLLSNIKNEEYEDTFVSEKKSILLDSDSTISQVARAAALLGYDLDDKDLGNVHKALMVICEKKDAVGGKELEALIASSAMQAPSTYHLENYTTTSSNVTGSVSQVTLTSNGETLTGVSMGDGPIDSAFRAIEQCIGHHYELDDFQVQSVTEGKEALGSALVRLRNNGKLYSGNGISADIVAASIRAYINALNKIVYEEA